jgi:hypothetical protein
MKLFSTQKKRSANRSGIITTENHLKNGTNLKNQMSKKKFYYLLFFMCYVAVIAWGK